MHIASKLSNSFSTLLICLMLILGNSCSQAQHSNTETAKHFLSLMKKGEYAKCIALCDTSVSSKMNAKELGEIWSGLNSQLGEFKNVLSTEVEKADTLEIVHQICKFEKSGVDFKLVFDKKGKICGIFFAPPGANGKGYKEPSYAVQNSFTEEAVTIKSGEYNLPGTLTVPIGGDKFPLVILVHGSGPGDRDESIGPNKPFKDIAWALASQRIAVFRYDKRTRVYGAKMVGQQITVKEETIDDAIACVKQLKKNSIIDSSKVFLCGHSLGAMLMPRIVNSYPDLAGVIMLAGNARPLEELIAEQVAYILKNTNPKSAEGQAQLEKIKKQVRLVKGENLNLQTPSSELPLGVPAAYWIDLNNNNQVEAFKKLKLPVLILQGEKDYQVTMEDFAIWKNNVGERKNITMKSYPALGHLFMDCKGAKCLPSDYEVPQNVAEYVITDLVKWVKEH